MIIERAMALTCWAWFIREGKAITLPSVGTVGYSVLPDPSEDWINIGKVAKWTRKVDRTAEDVMAPSAAAPGLLSRQARITTGVKEDYEFETLELNALALGLAFGAPDELTSATDTFVPNSTYSVNGWLKLQKYTDKNENFFNRNLWCQLDAEVSEGGIIKPKFMAYVIPVAADVASGTE